MRSLLPLTVYCISLLSLQQLLTAALEERPEPNRLDLLNKLFKQREDKALDSGSQLDITVLSPTTRKSLAWLIRHPSALRARRALPTLVEPQSSDVLQIKPRHSRVRRHAHLRGGHHSSHHAQLMRVGCVLGTCQVQNLSHRLYQLIGQSGREDSSPINPSSPHSYG